MGMYLALDLGSTEIAAILADALGLPLVRPAHAEEAAFGAALLATTATGEHTDLAAARRPIRYEPDPP